MMREKVFLLLFFCFVPFYAAAQKKEGVPTVKLTRVDTKIRYDASSEITKCGPSASGCTSAFLTSMTSINCINREIEISFGYPEILVQIAASYQKGSVEFDAILKHELTHVALRKRIVEKFYQPTASALLMQYEKSEKDGKSCGGIKNDVRLLFKKYMDRLQQEVDKHDQMIDGKENYLYQSKQIAEKKLEGIHGKKEKQHGKIKIAKHFEPTSPTEKVKKEKAIDLSLIPAQPASQKTVAVVNRSSLPQRRDTFAAEEYLPTVEKYSSAAEQQNSVEKKQKTTAPTQRKKTKEQQISELPVMKTIDIILAEIIDEFKLKEKFTGFLRGILGVEPTLPSAGSVENKPVQSNPNKN